MGVNLDGFIGDEATYPLEHRILNTVLLICVLITAFFSVSDYLIGLRSSAILNVCACLTACGLYYLALVRRAYHPALGLAIAVAFLILPAVWFTNAGVYGGTSLTVVIIAAMISVTVKNARVIFGLVGCLASQAVALLAIQYYFPWSVVDYNDRVLLFTDKFIGLTIALVVITSLYVIILNYYRREHRRATDYLVRLEKQENALEMARLDRLNLIGEMAAGIGHEVRNPLTTIRGFLQLFRNKREYEAHSEHFDMMIGELDRANSIISEFLSLAKNKAVRLERLNVNEILERIAPLIQAGALEAGKKVWLQLGEVPPIEADEGEIRQLVLNLTGNALDAIGPDGRAVIGTYRGEGCAILFVSDTGRGIPPEIYQRLGTPFVTSKEKGTGLGIPICYRIAERHKAKIEIDTGTGGTTFRVRFAAAEREEDGANAAAAGGE
jgi:signal transduction histidine kinase